MPLTPHDLFIIFLALGTLLFAARVLGEVSKRFDQPSVLGELVAGILLGPTVLGAIAPDFFQFLFPSDGSVAVFFDGITQLAIVLFLLVAGMEVDLSTMWRQGKAGMSVGLSGIFAPFALGFAAAWLMPRAMGIEPGGDRLIFALFVATALSISALPVIAKILMDLGVYRSDMGMVVIAAAVFNDLVGWVAFALILSLLNLPGGNDLGLGWTVFLTLAFMVFILTIGRQLLHRVLPWVQAHTTWPGGVLGLAMSVALFGAAFTEWIGVHAIFGSFLVGVAIGDSRHLREQTRTTIHEFISFFFAPLFFASIGLKVDFLSHFDPVLVVIVLVIASIGKIPACGLGAMLGGIAPRESWAIGFAMNARGAMEIILGLLALQNQLIGERMFVALVVMAVVTSALSGPAIQRILRLSRPRHVGDYLTARGLIRLRATQRDLAIKELVEGLVGEGELARTMEQAVLARESLMPTGIGDGVAVPHARLEGLGGPQVALGLSQDGVDFNAPDGEPAQLIFLLLTSPDDDGAQVALLADIARSFHTRATREAVLRVGGYTELLALLKTLGH